MAVKQRIVVVEHVEVPKRHLKLEVPKWHFKFEVAICDLKRAPSPWRPAREIVQEALAQITWYHNITLIEKLDAAIAANLEELGYGG